MSQEQIRKMHLEKIIDCIILISFFLLAVYWAVSIPRASAPDELMREWIPEYIFRHHKLPLPTDTEVVAKPFNASYAYYPLLLGSIVGAMFMKIAAILGFTSEVQLRIAGRMVSVLCGTISVFFLLKITKKLIKKNSLIRYGIVLLGCFLPQFVYLSSYINNDIIAVLASTIMVYAWILALEDGWHLKNAIILAIGIVICALSYYNAYGWILMSILIFISGFIRRQDKRIRIDYKNLFRYGIIISILVISCISYFFIRSYVVNHGDMLGMKSFLSACEEGGSEEQKPSNRETGKNLGMNYLELILSTRWYGHNWIWYTFRSFICILGSFDVFIADQYYYFYEGIFCIGLIGMLIRIGKKEKKNTRLLLFYLALFLSSIITILLSIQYSYATDYQPQGRYVYPIWICLLIFVSLGIQYIWELCNQWIKKDTLRKIIKYFICIVTLIIVILVIVAANTALMASINING